MIGAQDLLRLRELHVRARRGWMMRGEQPEYAELTERLFAALNEREARRSARPCRRRQLRIRRAMQVELGWVNGQTTGLTRDVGTGGFCATVGVKPDASGPVVARLRLPGAAPIVAPARVVRASERGGSVTVSVALEELERADAERLRAALLDDALSLAAIHATDLATAVAAPIRLDVG